MKLQLVVAVGLVATLLVAYTDAALVSALIIITNVHASRV